MRDKKYTKGELEAAYSNGYNKAASEWLVFGIAIGFIAGLCIVYIKLIN